ncbi:MAG: hypothetical protein CW338_00235 [Clostridiales bacterium]|nr:hypothetical protein [Clostridiales bacterium]
MLTALLMACGLSLCGLKAMTGVFSAGACLLWCFSGALTVWCAVMMKKKGALLLAGLFISQVILFFFQKGLFFALEQLFRAVILRVRGDEGVFGFYTPQIVCAFSYTVSMLITFFALQGATGSCAALSVGLLTAAALLSGGDRHTLVYAVPVMAGLMLMLCRDRKGVRWIAIPLCIALAVIAYILVPSNSGAVSPFYHASAGRRGTAEAVSFTPLCLAVS